ncbi:phenylacetate--CoA ligase family protein [Streptomyces sp. NPDC085932]|uniref:phenylacetate--CoA ligase family protein n=1 Tax=Streptomyces sp. NPDC085932 TaxID=3365741 RepID=UPI0037D73126
MASANTSHTDDFWDGELDPLPWEEVLDWQARILPSTVADVRARSPFYRRKFGADVRSLGDFGQLPFTTKEELRQAQDEADASAPYGAAQAVPTERVSQTLASSGTTGHPTLYALTATDVDRWSDAVANMLFTAGVRETDTFALLTGMPMVAGGQPYAGGIRRVGANLVWLGGMPTERQLDIMRKVRTTGILATTSFAAHLADRCQDIIGVPAPALGVRRLLCGGEPGLAQPEIRRQIADGWGADGVHEVMGLCDVMAGMWAECEHGGGMHFTAARHVLVELIDPQTLERVEWKEGATGELVYTPLGREGTPVIRFRSADRAVVTGTSCACGRGAPRIRCVGRTDDMLIYKAMNVFPSAIRDVVLDVAAGRVSSRMRVLKHHRDQVRFDSPIPLQVEAASMDEAEAAKTLIESAVRSRLQVRVDVDIVPPGSLPQGQYKNPLVQVSEGTGA